MSLVEMYADESYSDEGPRLLCLAGYLYERDQAVAATEEWMAVLKHESLPYELPFFRMSSCAHGNKPFDGFTRDQCGFVESKMIEIVRKRSIFGLGATVNEKEYEQIIPKSDRWPNPYAFLAQNLVHQVKGWADRTSYDGKILYNFEAGHKHQGITGKILEKISKDEELTKRYRYAGHAFVEKENTPIVQSADLIAWHTFQDRKRQFRGEGQRRDYSLMLRPQDIVQHWPREHLEKAALIIQQYEDWPSKVTALSQES